MIERLFKADTSIQMWSAAGLEQTTAGLKLCAAVRTRITQDLKFVKFLKLKGEQLPQAWRERVLHGSTRIAVKLT